VAVRLDRVRWSRLRLKGSVANPPPKSRIARIDASTPASCDSADAVRTSAYMGPSSSFGPPRFFFFLPDLTPALTAGRVAP
jgi:hypothetical protein